MITKRLRLPPSTFVFFLILSGALGLRVWHLSRESLWFDEILTATLAQQSITRIAPILLRYDIHPPLHYYAVWASLRLFGNLGPEVAARLPSALASTAAAGSIFALARRLWQTDTGNTVGLLSAALFALAPFQVEYAQEARHYAFLVLWTLVAAWGLAWVLDEKRAPKVAGWLHPGWLLWLVGGTCALYTHYFALLALTGVALFGALSAVRLWRDDRRRLAMHLAGVALPFLLFVPWLAQGGQQLAQMTGRSGSSGGLWGPRLLSLELLRDLFYALGAGTASPWRQVLPALAALGLASLLVRREWRALSFAFSWYLPSLIFLQVVPKQPIPNRYLIFWGPVLLLLVGRGVYGLTELAAALARKPAWRGYAVLVCGGLCCLTLWPGLQGYYATHKHDWRGLARLVDASPPIPVYIPWMPEVADFYSRPDRRNLIRDVRDPEELRKRLSSEPRAWLIVTSIQQAFDPGDKLGEAWRSLNHIDLTFWGDLHLVYVGAQAPPADLAAEIERLDLPALAPVWLSLGRAYRQAGDRASAERVLRRAAQLASADPYPFYLREVAGELRLLGLHDEASDLYRLALRRIPDDIQTRLGLAASAVALQRPDEALQALAPLPRTEASQYWPERLSGEAYRQKGQLTQALIHFRAAQTANPSDPDICALLAMASEENNDPREAVAWWQHYLERAPQGPFRVMACRYLEGQPGSPCTSGQ